MVTPARSHRSGMLDSIRAIAILMVVGFHTAAIYDPVQLDAAARLFVAYGSKGVDIFFPLSGYLITRFLLTHYGTEAIKVFFLRRVFRIVPLYMAALACYLAAMLLIGFDRHLFDRMWIPLTFLTGWFIFADGVDTVPYTITWSLSVEEFAYIVLGLLAWITRRRLPVVMVLLVLAPMVLRYWLIAVHDSDGIYFLPLTRIDSIVLGGLAAWGLMHRRAATVQAVLLGLFAMCWLVALQDPVLWRTLVYTLVSLATCMGIVLFDTTLKSVGGAVVRFGAFIGFHSYFTYLFHLFNLYGMETALARAGMPLPPFWILFGIVMGATQVQAVISHRVFEGPLMRYGRSLERRLGLSGAVAVSGPPTGVSGFAHREG